MLLNRILKFVLAHSISSYTKEYGADIWIAVLANVMCVSVILNFVYIPFKIQDDIVDVYNSTELIVYILHISNTKASLLCGMCTINSFYNHMKLNVYSSLWMCTINSFYNHMKPNVYSSFFKPKNIYCWWDQKLCCITCKNHEIYVFFLGHKLARDVRGWSKWSKRRRKTMEFFGICWSKVSNLLLMCIFCRDYLPVKLC